MILFFGDSIVNGFPFARKSSFPDLFGEMTGFEIRNTGMNGATSGEISRIFRSEMETARAQREKVSTVVIMCGSNDLVMGVGSAKSALANVKEMIEAGYAAGADVVVMSPPLTDAAKAGRLWMPADYEAVNSELEKYRGLLEDLCEKTGALFVDIQSAYAEFAAGAEGVSAYVDGVHPTKEGQRFIAEEVAALAMKRERPRRRGKRAESAISAAG